MAIEHLNEDERIALQVWKEKKQPSLSITASMKLFQLFVNGRSMQEIVSANPGMFLGQILEARARDGWDEQKNQYLDHLYGTILSRLKQTHAESVTFTQDLLASAHKLYGKRLEKFLQSGNEEDLGEAVNLIKTLAAYEKAAGLMLKLIGQDKGKERETVFLPRPEPIGPPPPTQRVLDAASTTETVPVVPGSTEVVQPGLAAQILRFFSERNETPE